MALELDGAWGGDFGFEAAAWGGGLEFEVVLDDDAVVFYGEDGGVGFFTGGVELGGGVGDVVGLPLEGGIAHVELGSAVVVDAAALVVFALEAETVEDLQFIAVLDVDAAVAPALAAAEGFEGEDEFEVQVKGLEGLLGFAAGGEPFPFIEVAVVPGVGGAAVEEDDGAFGGFGTLGGAVAHDALELEGGALVGFSAEAEGVEGGGPGAFESDGVALALAFDFDFGGAIPAGTGEALAVEDGAEGVVAEGDDVGAELGVAEAAFVFALFGEVGAGGFWGGVGGRFGGLGFVFGAAEGR